MADIQLHGVTVDFPIYNASTRSLKNHLIRSKAGGVIGRDAGHRACVRALDGISLHIEHGDRVALLGHNGAGKTTMLRVLANVYEPTQGHVRLQGRVASLFDLSLGMDPELTGFENILLRGLFLGLRPADARQRSDEIADFTGLGEYLSMPVRTYSSGMMMRLAFAVCTSVKPDILLMDEWIGVGDASFTEKAAGRLKEFVDSAGLLVLASHNLDLVLRNCTKGVLLDGGQVKAYGPIDDVMQAYKKAS